MKLSLGKKLILGGVSLVTLPLLFMAIVSYLNASGSLRENANALLQAKSEDMATMVERILRSEMQTPGAVANTSFARDVLLDAAAGHMNAEKKTAADAELHRILKLLGENYEGLWIVDAKGHMQAGVLLDGSTKAYAGMVIADRRYHQQMLQTSKPAIGEPVISKVNGRPISVLISPIFHEGQLLGGVGLSITLDYLSNVVSSAKLGKTGYAFMSAKDGVVLAHPKTENVMKLEIAKLVGMERLMESIRTGRSGILNYVFYGVPKTAACSFVGSTGWAVVATQDDEEFLASAHRMRNLSILMAFACMVIVGAICWWFARGISRPIEQVILGLLQGAQEVTAASRQVSSASQGVASMASEQAASLEETSASLEELSSMAVQNADNSRKASEQMVSSGRLAESANMEAQQLAKSMQEIQSASNETAKIIKTIDDIAFQTNILALNAAVEAARAGEAGAGFAVVAEEVRNLASRSAEASRNSSQLILGSNEKINKGVEQANSTGASFATIVRQTTEISTILKEVVVASQEQSKGISEINRAVAQMDKAVQSNASSSEETASAAEELNAQSELIRSYVENLSKLVHGDARHSESQKTEALALLDGSHS